MKLKDVSTEDLQAELQRREEAAALRPPPVDKPNWQPLHVMLAEYAAWCDSDDYHEDNDWAHHIYEKAVETVYGTAFFDWINKVRS